MRSGMQKQEIKMVMVDSDGQPHFELPFTPFSEWKQEEGCAVLVIHSLPDFTEGGIRVRIQNLNRLRVYGESQISLTTFSFDETYPIPEDCTTSGMQTMFEDGCFYVMLQKKNNIRPVGFKRNQAKPTQQTPKPIEEVKDSTPPKSSPSIRPTEQPTDEAPPPGSTAGGRGHGKPAEDPSKSQMDKENGGRQSISTTTKAKTSEAPTKLKSHEDGETINLGKASAPKSTTEALMSSGEALSSKPKAEKVSEGQREDDIAEKHFIKPKDDEEERKLLVNIGVAAVVIVALAAYVWSST